MKTFAPVLTLFVLNLAVLLGARGMSRSAHSPPKTTAKPSFELIHEVVHFRAPLRRKHVGPRVGLAGVAAVQPVAWRAPREHGPGVGLPRDEVVSRANDRP